MIIALVQFKLQQPISVARAQEIYLDTAPRYLDVPGLLAKSYILSEDGSTAGGMYCWESRQAAEEMYTEEWKAFVRGKYGTEPVLAYYASPVQVDVSTRQITTK